MLCKLFCWTSFWCKSSWCHACCLLLSCDASRKQPYASSGEMSGFEVVCSWGCCGLLYACCIGISASAGIMMVLSCCLQLRLLWSVVCLLHRHSCTLLLGEFTAAQSTSCWHGYCKWQCKMSDLLQPFCRLPGLFENIIRPPAGGPGLQLYMSLYNSIWLFVFACVSYGVVSSALYANTWWLRGHLRMRISVTPLTPKLMHIPHSSAHCLMLKKQAQSRCICSPCKFERRPVALCLQGSCLTGQTPRLPIVAGAAEQQLRW